MNFREWALPIFTILIQLVTGMFFLLWILRVIHRKNIDEQHLDEIAKIPVLIFVFTIIVAIISSHFHLSRPFMSLLALLNQDSSWLSRETGFSLLFLIFSVVLLYKLWAKEGSYKANTRLGWAAILGGLATIWSMAFIYLLPTQFAWNSYLTVVSYFSTTFLLGSISLLVILLMDYTFSVRLNHQLVAEVKILVIKKSLVGLTTTAVVAAFLVLVTNLFQVNFLKQSNLESAQISLQLITELYMPLVILRFTLLGLGLSFLALCPIRKLSKRKNLGGMINTVYFACLFVLVGEILERFLFYAVHVRVGI
jgi:anaerobic dimethyl sulfoxide reductase subunit C (anchor subunit)